MKKINSLISAAAVSALAVSAIPFSASAADGDVVYGTMNIPYADFYAAEFEGASNSFEVDAVSSATANKWKMNNTGAVGEDGTWQSGGLSAGTYYEANEDGNGGKILGVTYPVAVNAADVDFLTANYGFTALDSAPAAYKEVTVADGAITVSKLVDTDGEVEAGGNISLETTTSYGDYQLIVEGYPQDADVYGAIVKTADGNSYPMRALENLWRPKSEIAWSVGYVTATHGNNIDNPKYYPTNGATVTGVTFITLDGYRTVSGVNVYLPKMFTNGVKVEDSAAGSGSTTYDTSAFPADYEQTANVAEGFTAENGTINYTGAQPGSYTLTISDAKGVYADVRGTFTLTTADIPVKYEDGKLVAADGFTEADAANFIKNITSVEVNGTAYRTGRRGTTVIKADGTVDFEAKSGENAVFDGSGEYSLNVQATGYTAPYVFAISSQTPATTEAGSTTAATTTTAKATTTTAAKTTAKAASGTDSPKTGVATAAVPAAALALAAAAAFTFRKKND